MSTSLEPWTVFWRNKSNVNHEQDTKSFWMITTFSCPFSRQERKHAQTLFSSVSLPMNLFGGRREKQIILLASGGEHLLVRHIFFASSLNFSHKNLRMWIEVFGLSCKCTTRFLCHSLLVFIVTASIELHGLRSCFASAAQCTISLYI